MDILRLDNPVYSCCYLLFAKDIQYVNKLLDKVFTGKHKNDNKLKSFSNDLS